MKKFKFEIPLLPPSLNVYRNYHWTRQRNVQERWREYIWVQWLELRRPRFKAVNVTLHFYFKDRRHRDLDNYIATGSKLVGDAIKGRFIPDDNPDYLCGWSFRFGFDSHGPKTIIEIEEKEVKPMATLSPIILEENEPQAACNQFETCSAPLCPLDPESLKHGIWYPDEEICTSTPGHGVSWIKNQRAIARKAANSDTYFTFGMLDRKFRIRRGITGLDPDKEEAGQLQKWFEGHPEITAEETEQRRELALKIFGEGWSKKRGR